GPADRGMSLRQGRIESDSTMGRRDRRFARFLCRHEGQVGERTVRLRQSRVCGGVFRIERDRLLKRVPCREESLELTIEPVHEETAAEVEMIRLEIGGWLPDDGLVGGPDQRDLQALGDR